MALESTNHEVFENNVSKLVVISFNVKSDSFYARKNKWSHRKDITHKILKELDPTLIGVQELKNSVKEDFKQMFPNFEFYGTGRSKRLLGEHSDIIINSEKAKVTQDHSFWLSKKPHKKGSRATFAFFPRICTTCELVLKDSGQKIRVFNTHFDHISPIARNISARIISEMAFRRNKQEYLPTIVMGDFNARQNSRTVKIFSENLHGLNGLEFKSVFGDNKPHNTYHGFSGRQHGHQIDYIFVTKEFEILSSFVETGSENGSFPSDHYPIVAHLQLKRNCSHGL